jgi:hypothetical protein
MASPVIGLASFLVIFGGALLGMLAGRLLPDHHLSDQTRAAVSVSLAIVGTLSALVIGLMISSANNSFSSRSHEVTGISVDLIRMDRQMRRYGSEADDARAKLRIYAMAKMQELFPKPEDPPRTNEATIEMLEAMQDAILSLTPTDERHRWIRSELLTLSASLAQTRWQLDEQTGSDIPVPFIILLILWLAIVFASFGLFAPVNGIVIVSLCLSSMAVAGGIMMILELDSPFYGLIHVSGEPLRNALAQILH